MSKLFNDEVVADLGHLKAAWLWAKKRGWVLLIGIAVVLTGAYALIRWAL